MATNAEAGKSFVADVIGKLPAEQQAQARAIFEAAEAAAALEEAGRGYKSLSETSRLADEARAEKQRAQETYNQNKAWYDANATELQNAAAYRQRLAELEAAPKPPATPDPAAPAPAPKPPDPAAPKYVTADEQNRMAQEALGLFLIVGPRLIRRHEKLFGEELDTEPLIIEAQSKGLTLEQAYNAKYATQLKQKAEEAEAARVQKIKDEAVAEFRQKNPQMPYITPGSNAGSPLDGLKPGAPVDPGVNRNLVDEAVDEYNRLVAPKT